MLVRVPRERFVSLIESLSSTLGKEVVDESALTSYLHTNPLIPWIVWRRLETVLALAGAQALAGAVLDFGCGTGALLPSLCAHARVVYGTDLELAFSRQFVEEEGLDVQLLAPENVETTIEAGSLSCITAVEVLEHIDDLAPVLERFRRLLAPEGRLVVSLPTENGMYKICRAIAGFSGDYHKRTMEDIHHDIERAGFVKEARRYLPFSFGPSLFVATAYRDV